MSTHPVQNTKGESPVRMARWASVPEMCPKGHEDTFERIFHRNEAHGSPEYKRPGFQKHSIPKDFKLISGRRAALSGQFAQPLRTDCL